MGEPKSVPLDGDNALALGVLENLYHTLGFGTRRGRNQIYCWRRKASCRQQQALNVLVEAPYPGPHQLCERARQLQLGARSRTAERPRELECVEGISAGDLMDP